MRIQSIASGSSGNCIYIGSDNTHILVDAGISKKKIEAGLAVAELSGADIDAICITHEHADHIACLGILARKYGIPMYATADTISAIEQEKSLGKYDSGLFSEIKAGEAFYIGDVKVQPFRTYHDAADPVGYRFTADGKRAAVATDTGHFDDDLINSLTGLNAVLLESNHDVRMLETGPYPYYLKRRILSDKGHLSNENCGRLLCSILNEGMEHIFLGHLSKENNYPDLAYEAVRCEIAQNDCCWKPDDFEITVARRDAPLRPVEL